MVIRYDNVVMVLYGDAMVRGMEWYGTVQYSMVICDMVMNGIMW